MENYSRRIRKSTNKKILASVSQKHVQILFLFEHRSIMIKKYMYWLHSVWYSFISGLNTTKPGFGVSDKAILKSLFLTTETS